MPHKCGMSTHKIQGTQRCSFASALLRNIYSDIRNSLANRMSINTIFKNEWSLSLIRLYHKQFTFSLWVAKTLHVSVGLRDGYNKAIFNIIYRFCMGSMYIPISSGHLCPNMERAVPPKHWCSHLQYRRNWMNVDASTYPEDKAVGSSAILAKIRASVRVNAMPQCSSWEESN